MDLIRIATRESPLALWQAKYVRDFLQKKWPKLKVDLVPMTTSGDKFLKDKLLVAGGKGLFVKELEEALLNNQADIAVHSTKDMPAQLPDGLEISAFCARENPFDALLSCNNLKLNELPNNALIGTASLRRQSQLLAYRPDLRIQTLRGNINTRIAKFEAGDYDAIVLAASGLMRMNFTDKISEILSEQVMLPACGQGALCIESRMMDERILSFIAPLNDEASSICVQTERLVNKQLGGNCHVPLAVYCKETSPNQLTLRARILNDNGEQCIQDTRIGSPSQMVELATQCTDSLIQQGAMQLLGN